MKSIGKIAKIVMKVLEVFHWVATGLMLAAAICSAVAPQWLGYFVGIDTTGEAAELSTYGFEVTVAVADGKMDMTTFLLFAIGAVIILALMAMVCRNLYLIIKSSEGATPFQKDNVRMLKEIGIFSIAMPIVGFIMSIITRLVVGVEAVEISNSTSGFVMGLVVLCLTQYFAHGVELENEVDGLV